MQFRKQYVNLHTHSIGSMLDGQGKPSAYFERAQSLGMAGLALTDHGNLHLLLDWYDAGIESGVKPILGIEAYQARKTRFDRDPEERAGPASAEWAQRGPYHLTILAKNLQGYRNLIKLSSGAYLEGYYGKPRVDLNMLDQYSDGLIILSGCLNGQVQQALLRDDIDAAISSAYDMQQIVGKENYFIEIQDHGIEEQKHVIPGLIQVANSIGAPLVPTGDCHYVHKHDAEAHDIMICVSTKATVDQEDRFKFHGPEFYLKSYEEMVHIFEPEWLENTMNICDMIDVKLDFGEMYFPEFLDLPTNETVDSFLAQQVWLGAGKRYGVNPPEVVRERIEHELAVVGRMGFQEYFLVVADIINWGKSQGIRFGPGRGSAAGSILSYCLNITTLDPLKYGLLFERFLVEGRKSPPDIDIDIDDRYRDVVVDYVREKYGHDKVAHICTFSSVKTKSAIRDATRVLGFDYLLGDSLAKMVPPPVFGVEKTIQESLIKSPELAKEYETNPDAKTIIDAAKGLEGVYRQPGIHAAGVVIARGAVTDFAPVMQRTDGPVVTQWPMERVEEVGLLKIDFLGLRNLGVIDLCLENIKRIHGIDIDIENIDFDDGLTYRELCKGNSIGAFQIESAGMREMMLSLRPDSIDDIMALISLFRPGPMGSGMDKMFINRKHGNERIVFEDPKLQEVLSDTYGIMLYQEDVLNVCRVLAGFDAGEADDLRKVIGKKLMDKVEQYRTKFVQGCIETSNVTEFVADKIYSKIVHFAGYGFGKAHAAGYGVISYQTAFLKFHYPAEYMAALLTSVAGKKEKLTLYLNECRKLGIDVSPPSILRSENDFIVSGDNQILFGLSAVNGIGESIIGSILGSRKPIGESNLYQFLRDVDSAVLNKGSLEHLIRSGALDELVTTETPTLNAEMKRELLEAERRELGIYVTDHPLLAVWQFIEDRVTCHIDALETVNSGQNITLGGLITKVDKRITKKGQRMFKLSFEDMTGDIDIVVFPKEASKLGDDPFHVGDIGLITGQFTKESAEIKGSDEEHFIFKLFFNEFESLDPEMFIGTEPIVLRVDRSLGVDELQRISDIIDSRLGESLVFLEVNKDGKTILMKFKKRTAFELKEPLEQLIELGVGDNNW